MSKSDNNGKQKKMSFAGFLIRDIERKNGTAYQVDIGHRNEKHVRRSFKTLGQAKLFAQRTRNEVEAIGNQSWQLSDKQRLEAVEAFRMLKGSKATLADAIECYLKHNPIKTSKKTSLGYMAEAYISDKRKQAERGDLRPQTVEDAEKRLMRFVRGNEKLQIIKLTAEDVDAWLDSHDWKPVNRTNYKRAISVFLNWCISQGVIDANVTKQTRKTRPDAHVPTLWTAQETAAIFTAALDFDHEARDSFVAYLALIFFAGLRPTEATRLDWKQVDLDIGEIHIGPEVSKTRRGRIVHMEPNLKTWLLKYRSTGAVWKHSHKTMYKCREAVTSATGTKWRMDAARHSFATYHLAKHNSIDQTVQELGHTSPQMLFQNYFGLAKNRTDQAEKYFQIEPKQTKTTAFKRA